MPSAGDQGSGSVAQRGGADGAAVAVSTRAAPTRKQASQQRKTASTAEHAAARAVAFEPQRLVSSLQPHLQLSVQQQLSELPAGHTVLHSGGQDQNLVLLDSYFGQMQDFWPSQPANYSASLAAGAGRPGAPLQAEAVPARLPGSWRHAEHLQHIGGSGQTLRRLLSEPPGTVHSFHLGHSSDAFEAVQVQGSSATTSPSVSQHEALVARHHAQPAGFYPTRVLSMPAVLNGHVAALSEAAAAWAPGAASAAVSPGMARLFASPSDVSTATLAAGSLPGGHCGTAAPGAGDTCAVAGHITGVWSLPSADAAWDEEDGLEVPIMGIELHTDGRALLVQQQHGGTGHLAQYSAAASADAAAMTELQLQMAGGLGLPGTPLLFIDEGHIVGVEERRCASNSSTDEGSGDSGGNTVPIWLAQHQAAGHHGSGAVAAAGGEAQLSSLTGVPTTGASRAQLPILPLFDAAAVAPQLNLDAQHALTCEPAGTVKQTLWQAPLLAQAGMAAAQRAPAGHGVAHTRCQVTRVPEASSSSALAALALAPAPALPRAQFPQQWGSSGQSHPPHHM